MPDDLILNINNILIIDDEAVIRKSVSRALADSGIKSVAASNGPDALEILKEQQFDLALLDIKMPEMDGVSVLREIKSAYPALKVIMITGYPTIDTAVNCIRLGAADYLVK
ncbi:MAG: response regulator, partial [Desulfobacteraceae bacterium]